MSGLAVRWDGVSHGYGAADVVRDVTLAIGAGESVALLGHNGAGKTTLTRMLLQDKSLDLSLSVSVTTRQRRFSEVDGVHYRFIAPAQFADMRERDELLEWAEVHDNYYGTPRGPIEEILAEGRDVLLDIDYQGTEQVRAKARDEIVTLFILPPSIAELRTRLERRAEDGTEVIERRLLNARTEIQRWPLYDYVLINDDLQQAYRDVITILQAERLRRARRKEEIARFVDELLAVPAADAR